MENVNISFFFSSLRGSKKIENGKITFNSLVYLDIRGVRDDFCDALAEAFDIQKNTKPLDSSFSIKSVTCSSPEIKSDALKIKMLSPLTIRKTEDGITYYYNPLDEDFSEQINNNFQRKYTAFTGQKPISSIRLVPLSVGSKDKYVTTFKGIHITAWRGEYNLYGNSEYLNFLYYCGLGARNSNSCKCFERNDNSKFSFLCNVSF